MARNRIIGRETQKMQEYSRNRSIRQRVEV